MLLPISVGTTVISHLSWTTQGGGASSVALSPFSGPSLRPLPVTLLGSRWLFKGCLRYQVRTRKVKYVGVVSMGWLSGRGEGASLKSSYCDLENMTYLGICVCGPVKWDQKCSLDSRSSAQFWWNKICLCYSSRASSVGNRIGGEVQLCYWLS